MSATTRSPVARDTNPATKERGFDWPAYVDALTALHDLKLDTVQRDAVIRQLERIDALAQTFLEFPLEAEVEPAPVFRP